MCCCAADTAACGSSLWYLWCFSKQIWLHLCHGLKVWGGRREWGGAGGGGGGGGGSSVWGLLSSKVRKSINSCWWIIRFKQPLPGGLNAHMLRKDRTGTGAERRHDSSWLIRCGIRWGGHDLHLLAEICISAEQREWGGPWCFWLRISCLFGFWLWRVAFPQSRLRADFNEDHRKPAQWALQSRDSHTSPRPLLL